MSLTTGIIGHMTVRTRADEHFWGVVIEASDARALAEFYSRLLGWPIHRDRGTFVTLAAPSGGAYLAIQQSPEYVPPVWPAVDGAQQMMMHLDIEVGDRDAAAADAIDMGARWPDVQPPDDDTLWVLLDPAGHPFCLYVS